MQPHDTLPTDRNSIRLRYNRRCGLCFDLVNPCGFRLFGQLHAKNLAIITNADIDIPAIGIRECHKRDTNVLIERRFELYRL